MANKNEVVFVFGSNLAGRHGKGAALTATRRWGARQGIGCGRTGDAYALPTKCVNLKPLSLEEIAEYYKDFHHYALQNSDIQFLLTPIGTGLAGNTVMSIRSKVIIWPVPRNIWLTGDWTNIQGGLRK